MAQTQLPDGSRSGDPEWPGSTHPTPEHSASVPVTVCAELEIGLHRRERDRYAIELRFSHPDSDADIRLAATEPALAEFDLERLRSLVLDARAYGESLGQSLLADGAVYTGFAQARAAAESRNVPLRVRLFVGPEAAELHGMHWETLRDPRDGSPLLTGERLLFSRYLSSADWRTVGPQPKANLRALVAVASPHDVGTYQPGGQPLASVDAEGELARAREALGTIPTTSLARGDHTTLDSLAAALRDGWDILYLFCHGTLIRGEPYLYLEDRAGQVCVTPGRDLVERLKELRRPPSLVVLASCQSAGTGEGVCQDARGALAALGPRLAEAGIPAVLAMQGSVTLQTVAEFMPVFFRELQRDGQIDRAVAVARGAVRDRPDWWMPVLFLRLRSGRLWYTPGFAGRGSQLEKWPALLRYIQSGRCTPILGPGLTDWLLGSRRQIAERWAEVYGFPMAPHERESLPQVAQNMAVNQDEMFPRAELAEHVRAQVLGGQREAVSGSIGGLDALISAVDRQRREVSAADPHAALARLPLPIYVTANFSSLMADALADAGKQPRVALCPWNDRVEAAPELYSPGSTYRPDKDHPLVYHLFGSLSEPDSVVLTEDDYFDFLIGATSNRALIPPVVRRALADTALLFLGFRMDEWDFRVLFRSLMSQEGRGRRGRYAHVAVQIEPEEGRIRQPARARRYLESYFQGADISLYWGSTESFVTELLRRQGEGEP